MCKQSLGGKKLLKYSVLILLKVARYHQPCDSMWQVLNVITFFLCDFLMIWWIATLKKKKNRTQKNRNECKHSQSILFILFKWSKVLIMFEFFSWACYPHHFEFLQFFSSFLSSHNYYLLPRLSNPVWTCLPGFLWLGSHTTISTICCSRPTNGESTDFSRDSKTYCRLLSTDVG